MMYGNLSSFPIKVLVFYDKRNIFIMEGNPITRVNEAQVLLMGLVALLPE